MDVSTNDDVSNDMKQARRPLQPRSGDIYFAQCVSAGDTIVFKNVVSRGAAAFFSPLLVKRAVVCIEMSPLRGLNVFKRTCFPNAHALGYLDAAAPRLERTLVSEECPSGIIGA